MPVGETSVTLTDPLTGQTVYVMGFPGHDATIRHRPRVPVLDVPGKAGDSVQFLGRKSRVGSLRRCIATDALFGDVVGGEPGFIAASGLPVTVLSRLLAEFDATHFDSLQLRSLSAVSVAEFDAISSFDFQTRSLATVPLANFDANEELNGLNIRTAVSVTDASFTAT